MHGVRIVGAAPGRSKVRHDDVLVEAHPQRLCEVDHAPAIIMFDTDSLRKGCGRGRMQVVGPLFTAQLETDSEGAGSRDCEIFFLELTASMSQGNVLKWSNGL